jgi:hypothetical protein
MIDNVPRHSALSRTMRARSICFLAAVVIRHDLLEPSTISGGHFELDPLAHFGTIAQPRSDWDSYDCVNVQAPLAGRKRAQRADHLVFVEAVACTWS